MIAGLAGLDPRWSRTVTIADGDGSPLTAHALDSWNGREGQPELTLLCVHGNPTWSYLWRRLLAQAPPEWRVVAVDQIGMGYSARPAAPLHRGHPSTHLSRHPAPAPRRLADRVKDLSLMADALGVSGPVVTVAHDWGGPISLGWALDHPDQLVGVVLTNTAVTQPPGASAPTLIRAIRTAGVLRTMTVRTPGFLRGTLRLGPDRLPDDVRAGFLAPYPDAASRVAIGDFVADIPLDASHPSYAPLAAIAEGIRSLDVPVLMLWGPDDPVFSDLYLRDLMGRMPHADVHRYEGAAHLVTEDAPAAVPDLLRWVEERIVEEALGERSAIGSSLGAPDAGSRRDVVSGLRERGDDPAAAADTAIVELGDNPRVVTWRTLADRVDRLAAGLADAGVRPGDRVGLLIPPGVDLTACVYACWRAGAVVVVADAGLGVRGMGRALRGAAPDHLIAVPRGLALARALRLRIPCLRVVAGELNAAARAAGATLSLADVESRATTTPLSSLPDPDADAVVVFTSGATGPAKGVVYRHHQLEAQRDALTSLYGITGTDSLVAAFAPWAVLGPALGIASCVPDMSVTSPGSLRADALANAAAAVSATLVWASPAALRSVLATASTLTPLQRSALGGVRLLMSAGAPVPTSLLADATTLMPNAEPHTPYGMTEALPVADISLAQRREAQGRDDGAAGVCVGPPVPGVQLRIDPLVAGGITGEILVRAPHVKDRYDRLWATQSSTFDAGWHRTGDVGHLDESGWLWVEGRLAHVISTDHGPVTPVPVELAVEPLDWVSQAAAVGVGPDGVQQVVLVIVPAARAGNVLASLDQIDAVRAAVPAVAVAAVLLREDLPVDRRHNSKIDRAELAAWASRVLAGGRP